MKENTYLRIKREIEQAVKDGESVIMPTISIADMVELYNNGVIYRDPSYQRSSKWPKTSRNNFITELLAGEVVGQVRYGANLAIANKHSDDDYVHFNKRWNEGGLLSSTDGLHRATYLARFVNNEFKVYINGSGKYFKDLVQHRQEAFLAGEISAVIKIGASREDNGRSYRNHNKSTKPTNQENLNSYPYAIAEAVRVMSASMITAPEGDLPPCDVFDKDTYVYGKKVYPSFNPENDKLVNDEFITSLAKYQDNYKTPTKPGNLTDFWHTCEKVLTYDEKYLKGTFELAKNCFPADVTKSKTIQVWIRDFAICRSMVLHDEVKLSAENWKVFTERFKTLRDALIKETTKYELEGKKESQTYSGIVSLSPNTPSSYNKRIEILRARIVDVLLDEIDHYTELSPWTSDPETRHKLWVNQEYKCALTSREIVDPQDGNKWAVDHIIPRSKNGSNSFSNLQLICATLNQQLGNK